MQPYMREANTLKRADQVIQLHDKICTDNSFEIDLTKITESVQLINLAWVLAVCSCGHMEFKDLALNAKSESIRKNLIDLLHKRSELIKLKPKYYDEVDLIYAVTVTKTLSYEIPPNLVVELISIDPAFSKLCMSYPDSQQQTKKEAISELRQQANSLQQTTKERTQENSSDKAEKKPSAKGSAKSEIIRRELEKIVALIGQESAVNREILWSQLIEKANEPSSPFEKYRRGIIEKFTRKIWTKEEANYHLNKILDWHKETHAHLYVVK